MTEHGARIDAVAEALWCAIWEGPEAWDLARDEERETARAWARAALAADAAFKEDGQE